MKKKFFHIIAFSLFSAYSFAQKAKQDSVIILKVHDFGKCGYLDKHFYLTTGISSRYITTAFYFQSEGQKKFRFIPVNDKVFNYDYFNKFIYPYLNQDDSVKLVVKKYLINGEEILVAQKVEKME
ncbi:hypothetical protein F0919_08165 [Taibaiella lutea]|uniref:Uncharacterized protein n=1 Tax=Taibaiella lutea TaxID=2608001 RepID=A0A5M6CHV6_9BACT|nr:hypothetical protein [Taibaiella lutea]KAA5534586.1 hypothetical protein F0919_08165 [Taibaiella lutea]